MEKLINKNILLILCLVLLIISCTPIIKTLGPFSSPSIEESKKRGVFLWEYNPISVVISDSLSFNIKEVFVERTYGHRSYSDASFVIKEGESQIVINVDKNLFKLNCLVSWKIEEFKMVGANRFKRKYDTISPPNTVLVKIIKREERINVKDQDGNDIVLGSFVLKRKR
jgi:hypothetical protein